MGYEGLWAATLGGDRFRVDNIPFYVRVVSNGDVVEARMRNDELRYVRVVRRGGHSTLRVFVADVANVSTIRDALRARGCSTEVANIPRFVSVDVPPPVDCVAVRKMLRGYQRDDVLEFEDGCTQHRLR